MHEAYSSRRIRQKAGSLPPYFRSTHRVVPNGAVPVPVPGESFVLLAGLLFFLGNEEVALARLRCKQSSRQARAGKDMEWEPAMHPYSVELASDVYHFANSKLSYLGMRS